MHKRNSRRIQERRIRGIILRNSFFDREKAEFVCKVTRLEVLGAMQEGVEVHLVPELEVGEVLVDPRGHGSLQRFGC